VILSDRRTHYNLSYNASRGGPNWVSWNLNRTQFGKIPRAPTFYTDPLLVSYGAYQVTTCDYTGSGYTRGHMVQSEQRTQTRAENDTTFLMTNILPQTNELNTGPWGDLEEYGNELARFHQKEIYNVAGGTWPASPQYLTTTCGNANKVQIPTTTWKVMVIMPYGQGLADVTSASSVRVIAVDMPNTFTANNQPWTAYKVTVDQIEAITGYDLLAALPDAIEAAVESSIDP
jgi:endonuclease G